jgi:hypothetical protein
MKEAGVRVEVKRKIWSLPSYRSSGSSVTSTTDLDGATVTVVTRSHELAHLNLRLTDMSLYSKKGKTAKAGSPIDFSEHKDFTVDVFTLKGKLQYNGNFYALAKGARSAWVEVAGVATASSRSRYRWACLRRG